MRSPEPAGPADAGRAVRAINVALFGGALAISAYVLLWPTPPGQPPFPYADKLVHVLVFLAVAWTGSRLGLQLPGFVVALGAYAIGSEVFQHTLLPDRSGDWTDVVADLLGAGIGLLLARPGRAGGRER